jgi:transcriptional regulator with XRE-family HTH domain
MITAAQCRSARALLGWSLAKLAAAAGIAESDLDAFELERSTPQAALVNAIEQAFAGVGVAFLEDGDIRLLRPGETLTAGAERV